MPLPLGLERLKNGSAHLVDHLRQRLGRIYVDDKGVIMILYLLLLKAMPDKVSFPVATGRNQRNIVAIGQEPNNVLCFFYTVTEILRTGITISNKWVHPISLKIDAAKIQQFYHKMIIKR